MEVQLEELEAAATEGEIVAGKATTTTVAGFERAARCANLSPSTCRVSGW